MLSNNKNFFTVLAVILSVMLSACGFSPLLAEKKNKTEDAELSNWVNRSGTYTPERTIEEEMGMIYIQPIENRLGQQLRNLLKSRINPHGEPENALYTLEIKLQNPIYRQGVRTDDTATRATMTVHADYQLSHNNKVILNGKTRAVTGYNILRAVYGTVAAEQDVKERASRILSDDISLRLAVFFKDKMSK